ncbi:MULTISPECIES: class I SAM-dependent RNA methyltransferase [Sphingobacterium]|jgi:putative N6-adenine-specific DNA methylase|uniref:Class I SAM-dependent RNA methyltransferase n=2 Tax=Sphingobacterium TaxID=28453 RepID=A0ABW5Z397_9SPHI|nr:MULTISPECIES: RNA methyltransferase [Sphingobacterium]KKX48535.1 RNA methyltransferase [Sphingobacterium sp. IITKGP-BTPF85]MBB2953932.1 putative N6-adenine-specific DNA methylase [Sphingobacterium sp. JUb56]MCS3553278.1 putative N6-adenine-specific DNA methylase [Sphingobacterium sp. JUb21]MCW2262428.1 putative N6-adenine-specific DNA methylase [Sphingobacterium kitahiroshimense]QQD15706.1 class I SAM-dependent RNA methyltransferase [Sphingobacterium sp. UDSM-2020]
MEVFNTPNKIIITCNKRLSPYLQQEVEELGFEIKRSFSTGVELFNTLNETIKLNLNLRTASQILYSIKEFKASNPQELYDELKDIAWEELIAFDGYFSVTSNVDNETITTPLFANLKVKDAIVDRIKEKKDIRPNSGSDANKAVIHLYWKDDRAEVFIDSSGETLAKHGYRKHPGKAPMLEALAAGTILATKWDGLSSFVNPMCGSGTLAIEAALIATNRRPGLYRMNYSFMHFIGYDEEVFFQERRNLKEQVNKKANPKIIASDLSQQAVDIAIMNAKTAGVDQLIDFQVCDFADTTVPQEEKGIAIFNPEYGERLGNHSQLELTYKRVGDFLKQNCKGYKGYIFTGNPDLAKKIGLRASRKVEFYNGKLDCRLLEYELYEGTREKPKVIYE